MWVIEDQAFRQSPASFQRTFTGKLNRSRASDAQFGVLITTNSSLTSCTLAPRHCPKCFPSLSCAERFFLSVWWMLRVRQRERSDSACQTSDSLDHGEWLMVTLGMSPFRHLSGSISEQYSLGDSTQANTMLCALCFHLVCLAFQTGNIIPTQSLLHKVGVIHTFKGNSCLVRECYHCFSRAGLHIEMLYFTV